jgi:hypothetical protein
MRATAASFLLDGVAVAASPARRYRTSPRRLAPPVYARNAKCGRATAAADDDVAQPPSTPRSVLFVSFLWPEASSSAAGVRTRSLLEAFQAWGWQVHYLACARANEHTESLERSGVTAHRVSPNRGADFEDALDRASPDAVVFDRFTAEEAFSFRVRAARPTAARILDMQDLHALRRARHDAVKTALKKKKLATLSGADADLGESVLRASLAAVPAAGDPSVARELAAVHRCDLTLVCSPVETRLMRDRFGVPASKLVPASFFCAQSSSASKKTEKKTEKNPPRGSRPFASREGFTTIGTFYHPPNVDAVRWLAAEVWPKIRESLPDATMRVYGAYPTEAVKQLHKPKEGFLVLGFAESVAAAMDESRVLLAPLRFGAGIKGKIVDAWMHGLPVVTTPIGAEGMRPGEDALWSDCSARRSTIIKDEEEDWGGRWRSLDAASFARDAVALHEDAGAWERARARGSELIAELFAGEKNLAAVRDATEALFVEAEAEFENVREGGETERFSTTLEARRARDYVGGALWHHTLRSTEYFSRWIEMKETGTESGTELSVSDRE